MQSSPADNFSNRFATHGGIGYNDPQILMAKPFFCLYAIVLLLVFSPAPSYAQELVHHHMKILLDPESHHIKVEDRITLPASFLIRSQRRIRFLLHGGLSPSTSTPEVKIILERTSNRKDRVPLNEFSVSFPPKQNSFVLSYEGNINGLEPQEPDPDPHAISQSSGFITAKGIQLDLSSYWYPWFNDDLITFYLETQAPKPWIIISQGDRIEVPPFDDWAYTMWESKEPQNEIFLVGGPLTEYTKLHNVVLTQAYLRTPEQNLADKYLNATALYIDMYSKLIGPYPYKKFALVENFLETGIGLPSFTLMGPRVIRLPFIIDSSFPHEILHNWWGNGVFVDSEAGNWSEGLTAYLADHLIQEQYGKGAEFRRSILRRYTNYLTDGRDFPLILFRSRHDPAREAVGYGKTMMFFHMLRLQMGDKTFILALQEFYRSHKFKRANFFDIHRSFAKVLGRDLKTEFIQWMARTGAPEFRISQPQSIPSEDGFSVTALLEQIQPGRPYRLNIPIAVDMEGQETAFQTIVEMDDKRLELIVRVPFQPVRIHVDPEFDVFRRLSRQEIPPALGQTFRGERPLMLLPSGAPESLRSGYKKFAASLNRLATDGIETRLDNEIEELPQDRTVWVLGWDNKFFDTVKSALDPYQASISSTDIRISGIQLKRNRHWVVVTLPHPKNPDLSLTWIGTGNPNALPGLARKLRHYGKFSYLVFEGDEPSNILKDQWPILDSPLSVAIGVDEKPARAALAPRPALIDRPRIAPSSGG